MGPRVILDTNVLVAAIRSQNGASFRVLEETGRGRFDIVVTVPLVLEYEDAMKRVARSVGLAHKDVDEILDYLCRVAVKCPVFFLWRPFLKDASDDLVLEAAVEGECKYIVTHNVRVFDGSDQFRLEVIRPGEFLRRLEQKA